MANLKVSAIVPAFNEEKNVADVLRVLLSSKDLDQVILVDDGSTDKTSEVGKSLGATVIKLEKNKGKGNAMREGLKATSAQIVVFFDADLIGLSKEHISSLIKPILKDNFSMSVGIRGRLGGLPKVVAKIDPLMAIGGERAMRRSLLEKIPEEFTQGFAVEIALNHYCINNKLPICYVDLLGLDVVTKEKKWGFLRGFQNRIKMIWQMIKIRIKLCLVKLY